uniref:Uncharacterized protein n=1 Tax=Theileria annulata TaxID=5874 RepID=A0A3B0NA02_THEAN
MKDNCSGLKQNKTHLCYCNSDKCLLNRGLCFRSDVCENGLHKQRCCRPCMVNIANGRLNGGALNKNMDTKNKLIEKTKETEGAKPNTSESKKKLEDYKNNIIAKKPWVTPIKIVSMDKPEESSTKKKQTKRVNSSVKEKGNKLKLDSSVKTKTDKSSKSGTNKVKKETRKENEENPKNNEVDNENIYVSYSLKGYLRIKSKNKVEICDKYYTRSREICDVSNCVCTNDESDITVEETSCNCWEDCGILEDEYLEEQDEYNSCRCLG